MNATVTKLSERAVRRGLRINILSGTLGMAWVAVAMGIPLTMFLEALGASGVLMGLSVTVQQLATVVQIPSALLADRLARRKTVWACVTIVQRGIWVIPAVLPFVLGDHPEQMARAVVLLVAVSSIMIHSVAASWWSWMTDLVPEQRRGRFWGTRQSVVTAVHILAVWGSGRLLDVGSASGSYLGFQIVFAIAAALGTLEILIHLAVPEPEQQRAPRTGVLRDLRRPFESMDFRWLTASMGLWTFGIGLVGQYGFVYLRRAYEVSYADLALTAVSASMGVALFGVVWGYVMDRLGPRTVGTLVMALAPCFGVAWFMVRPGDVSFDAGLFAFSLPQPVCVLVVSSFFAGAVYSAAGLSQVGLLGAAVPAQGRTLAMAVHWSCVGLMASAGPLLAGVIMDVVEARQIVYTLPGGTAFSFFHILISLHVLVTWCLALPCLRRVRPGDREVPVRAAAARVFPTNPMRAIGTLYDIHALGGKSRERVARAVRRVGEKRSAIAVQDLIGRLDDLSSDVREEAVLALGRVACPEAVDELIRRMEDPQSDALPQIARALREARDPRSAQALVARLGDADRETVTEAARALGAIGDRGAASALLRLLRGSEDTKVAAAASDALARLGEFAAAYEILPRMLQAHSPVLRSSLAAAAADLLGEAGAFYRLVRREAEDRGTGVSAIISTLRSELKRGETEDVDERKRLREIAAALEEAYENRDPAGVRHRVIELTTGLAALRYGIRFGVDAEVMGDVLVWHNERLGIAAWYVSQLAEREQDPQEIDLLLGIFFLSCWRDPRRSRKSRSEPGATQQAAR